MDAYEKQLNIEAEREVEKEYKPNIDENDVKRADKLLKKDPLINEALIQGLITKEELILFIDYYEIFSLSNKAKKVTNEHLKALDELCIKTKNQENQNQEKNKKETHIDLNDEDAINKLTSEIEKKLENSEDILNKKFDYEKLMMNASKESNKSAMIDIKKENLQKILEKYNNDNNKNNIDKDVISVKSEKSSVSNITNKTGFTNFTNYSNIGKNNLISKKNEKNIDKEDKDKRPSTTKSEISNFTTEELMSVPKYTFYQKKIEKKSNNSSNINNNRNSNLNNSSNSSSVINKINNKTYYKNQNQNNPSYITKGENDLFNKPKTPLKPLSKDKSKTNRNNITNSNISSASVVNTSVSVVSGKRTIPPIKSSKNNNNGIKSKTNQRVDLFDDEANPLNMGKFRGARKDLIKLKMGGKSKMHELFSDKPRNLEENEKLRQKFMDFIQNGKENNKNADSNGLKKSIVRKKIEEAQQFNKFKK